MVCRGIFFAVDAVVRGAPFALEMVGDQLMTSDWGKLPDPPRGRHAFDTIMSGACVDTPIEEAS